LFLLVKLYPLSYWIGECFSLLILRCSRLSGFTE
jgi:hypothetical protein